MTRIDSSASRVTLIGLCIMAISVTSFRVLRAQTTKGEHKVRLVDTGLTQPIADLLLPDDDVVEILDRVVNDVFVPANPLTDRQVIEDVALTSDVVAVVHVQSVDSFLSDRGHWISTRLVGEAREIIRSKKGRSYTRGTRLEVHFPGGEIKLGNVTVRTAQPPPQILDNRVYLLFLRSCTTGSENCGGYFFPEYPPLLIENGKVMYISTFDRQNMPTNPLQGRSLRDVAKIVRGAKSAWSCPDCQ